MLLNSHIFSLYKVPCREGLRSSVVYLGDLPKGGYTWGYR